MRRSFCAVTELKARAANQGFLKGPTSAHQPFDKQNLPMTSNLAPGLLAIHSDRMEHLRDTVCGWLQANPLGPLEQETFLVQSNGVAS